MLANPRLGSFLLLGEVVTTAELEPDAPFVRDGCGTCRACVDACPVAAIRPDRTIDAGRCISRRTIETGDGDEGDLHGWLFGCDVCQRACPYNRKAPVSVHDSFAPLAELERLDVDDWLGLDEAGFRRIFRRNTACPVRFAPPTRADTQAEVKPDGCRDVRFFACFGTKSGLPLRLTFCLITDCIRGEKNENSGPANVCRIHNKTYFCELKTGSVFSKFKITICRYDDLVASN